MATAESEPNHPNAHHPTEQQQPSITANPNLSIINPNLSPTLHNLSPTTADNSSEGATVSSTPTNDSEFEVEAILDKRQRQSRTYYLIKVNCLILSFYI
jgi:hypothetical protein